MIWNHEWGSPAVVVILQGGRPLHTARQSCVRCGTVRNPFTQQLVIRRRGSSCHEASKIDHRDYSAELERVSWQLDALASDGHRVDHEHPRRIRPEAPELALPYKD